jgi:archaellum biogenesis ATPase FlaH
MEKIYLVLIFMGVPIQITGLNEFIHDIPDGNLILVEGSIDPIVTVFVQQLAHVATDHKDEVTYITSRTKEEVVEMVRFHNKTPPLFTVVEDPSYLHWKDHLKVNSMLVIDSFSYLILDKSLFEVRQILEDFLRMSRQQEAIVVITMEQGMLDPKIEVTIAHLADGIFHFLTKDTTVGVAHFIQIPKWVTGTSFDENIYYTFDGQRINVDLRSRVR